MIISGCGIAGSMPSTMQSTSLDTSTSSSATSSSSTMDDFDPDERMDVCINEVCANNDTLLEHPNGAYYDYIELYNPGDTPISLEGYGLSDTPGYPFRFTFGDVIIEAGGYLLCYAVGEDNMADVAKYYEIHLPFKLSASGETITLYAPGEVCVDRVVCDGMGKDKAFGRPEDGENTLVHLSGTPGKSNHGSDLRILGLSATPSHPSGFYEDDFELTFTVPKGCTLYYTVQNCENPLTSNLATIYTEEEPIYITDASLKKNVFTDYKVSSGAMYYPDTYVDKATVVRYALEDEEGRQSEVKTMVYFVDFEGKTGYDNLNVVSVVTDPSNLYDTENGIFMQANWNNKGRAYEREATVSMFGTEGETILTQQLGIRLHGASTRKSQQKSLSLFARSEYDGNKYLSAPIFEGVDEVKSLVLRDDRGYKFGESFMFSLVKDRAIDTAEYVPCVLFLEGEYYGIYNLYVRVSTHELEQKYGVDKDTIGIIKKGQLEAGIEQDREEYYELLDFMSTHDLSVPEHYEYVCHKIDMQSYMDYVAIQIYLANVDWSMKQNFACWKTRVIDPENPYADGRWRFILYDLDFCIGYTNSSYDQKWNAFTGVMPYTRTAVFSSSNTMLWPLLKNKDFCDAFALTLMDIANTNFAPDRARTLLQEKIDLFAPNMEKQYERFDGYSSSGAKRNETMYRQRTGRYFTFFVERFSYVAPQLKEQFTMTGELSSLTLHFDDRGSISLNHATDSLVSSGVSFQYFSGQSMTLKATPKAGYEFGGWIVDGIALSGEELKNPCLTFVMPSSEVKIEALFLPIS